MHPKTFIGHNIWLISLDRKSFFIYNNFMDFTDTKQKVW